jgi:hypothetical protein
MVSARVLLYILHSHRPLQSPKKHVCGQRYAPRAGKTDHMGFAALISLRSHRTRLHKQPLRHTLADIAHALVRGNSTFAFSPSLDTITTCTFYRTYCSQWSPP